MTDLDLHSIANVILYLGLPGILIFTVLLGLRSKWYINNQGKALFAIASAISLITVQIAATLIFGTDYQGREVARIITYLWFTISSWWLAGSIIKSQNKERREDRELLDEFKAAKALEAEHKAEEVVKPIPVVVINKPWYKKIFRKTK